MATQDNNSLEAILNEKLGAIGLLAKSTGGTTATASQPLYVDSASKLAHGSIPFAFPIVANGSSTTQSFLSLTGSSSLSGTGDMTLQLVAGAAFTTFTKTGAIRVTITDSAGNVVSGDHYIQLGSLS